MALSRRVSVAVTPKEWAALRWVARELMLSRHPHYSAKAKRPGAGAVLRQMSVAQALARYEMRAAQNGEAQPQE